MQQTDGRFPVVPEPDDAAATDQTDLTAEPTDEPDTTTEPDAHKPAAAAAEPTNPQRRGLLIGVSAVAIVASVLAIVFGVLYGQQSSKADKNARTATALQTRQDSYAKAIAAATEFTTTRTGPTNGNWTEWQSAMRSLVGPGLQDLYTDAKVAKVRAANLHLKVTAVQAGVTAARPDSCDVLVAAVLGDATNPQSTPMTQFSLVTVDESTNRIIKIG